MHRSCTFAHIVATDWLPSRLVSGRASAWSRPDSPEVSTEVVQQATALPDVVLDGTMLLEVELGLLEAEACHRGASPSDASRSAADLDAPLRPETLLGAPHAPRVGRCLGAHGRRCRAPGRGVDSVGPVDDDDTGGADSRWPGPRPGGRGPRGGYGRSAAAARVGHPVASRTHHRRPGRPAGRRPGSARPRAPARLRRHLSAAVARELHRRAGRGDSGAVVHRRHVAADAAVRGRPGRAARPGPRRAGGRPHRPAGREPAGTRRPEP